MKKILIIFVLVLFHANVVKAQSTPWELTGNTPSGTDFLGSTNTNPLELKTTNTGTPQPINFYTNNTQKMTILGNNTTTDGYVGIGLTNPLSSLEIFNNQNSNTYPALGLTYSTASSIRTTFRVSSTGNLLIFPQNNGSDKNVAIQSSGGSAATYKLTVWGDIGAQTENGNRKKNRCHFCF